MANSKSAISETTATPRDSTLKSFSSNTLESAVTAAVDEMQQRYGDASGILEKTKFSQGDQKTQIDADIQRLGSLLEKGKEEIVSRNLKQKNSPEADLVRKLIVLKTYYTENLRSFFVDLLNLSENLYQRQLELINFNTDETKRQQIRETAEKFKTGLEKLKQLFPGNNPTYIQQLSDEQYQWLREFLSVSQEAVSRVVSFPGKKINVEALNNLKQKQIELGDATNIRTAQGINDEYAQAQQQIQQSNSELEHAIKNNDITKIQDIFTQQIEKLQGTRTRTLEKQVEALLHRSEQLKKTRPSMLELLEEIGFTKKIIWRNDAFELADKKNSLLGQAGKSPETLQAFGKYMDFFYGRIFDTNPPQIDIRAYYLFRESAWAQDILANPANEDARTKMKRFEAFYSAFNFTHQQNIIRLQVLAELLIKELELAAQNLNANKLPDNQTRLEQAIISYSNMLTFVAQKQPGANLTVLFMESFGVLAQKDHGELLHKLKNVAESKFTPEAKAQLAIIANELQIVEKINTLVTTYQSDEKLFATSLQPINLGLAPEQLTLAMAAHNRALLTRYQHEAKAVLEADQKLLKLLNDGRRKSITIEKIKADIETLQAARIAHYAHADSILQRIRKQLAEKDVAVVLQADYDRLWAMSVELNRAYDQKNKQLRAQIIANSKSNDSFSVMQAKFLEAYEEKIAAYTAGVFGDKKQGIDTNRSAFDAIFSFYPPISNSNNKRENRELDYKTCVESFFEKNSKAEQNTSVCLAIEAVRALATLGGEALKFVKIRSDANSGYEFSVIEIQSINEKIAGLAKLTMKLCPEKEELIDVLIKERDKLIEKIMPADPATKKLQDMMKKLKLNLVVARDFADKCLDQKIQLKQYLVERAFQECVTKLKALEQQLAGDKHAAKNDSYYIIEQDVKNYRTYFATINQCHNPLIRSILIFHADRFMADEEARSQLLMLNQGMEFAIDGSRALNMPAVEFDTVLNSLKLPANETALLRSEHERRLKLSKLNTTNSIRDFLARHYFPANQSNCDKVKDWLLDPKVKYGDFMKKSQKELSVTLEPREFTNIIYYTLKRDAFIDLAKEQAEKLKINAYKAQPKSLASEFNQLTLHLNHVTKIAKVKIKLNRNSLFGSAPHSIAKGALAKAQDTIRIIDTILEHMPAMTADTAFLETHKQIWRNHHATQTKPTDLPKNPKGYEEFESMQFKLAQTLESFSKPIEDSFNTLTKEASVLIKEAELLNAEILKENTKANKANEKKLKSLTKKKKELTEKLRTGQQSLADLQNIIPKTEQLDKLAQLVDTASSQKISALIEKLKEVRASLEVKMRQYDVALRDINMGADVLSPKPDVLLQKTATPLPVRDGPKFIL